ncbi:hypothetical protein, partial [Pseudodesulfovibrio aespoeensis]
MSTIAPINAADEHAPALRDDRREQAGGIRPEPADTAPHEQAFVLSVQASGNRDNKATVQGFQDT